MGLQQRMIVGDMRSTRNHLNRPVLVFGGE
jgi:hypothetical protein